MIPIEKNVRAGLPWVFCVLVATFSSLALWSTTLGYLRCLAGETYPCTTFVAGAVACALVAFGLFMLWRCLRYREAAESTPNNTQLWYRRWQFWVGIGLFALVWFVTAPLVGSTSCRNERDWLCIACTILTALGMGASGWLIASALNLGHRHGHH